MSNNGKKIFGAFAIVVIVVGALMLQQVSMNAGHRSTGRGISARPLAAASAPTKKLASASAAAGGLPVSTRSELKTGPATILDLAAGFGLPAPTESDFAASACGRTPGSGEGGNPISDQCDANFASCELAKNRICNVRITYENKKVKSLDYTFDSDNIDPDAVASQFTSILGAGRTENPTFGRVILWRKEDIEVGFAQFKGVDDYGKPYNKFNIILTDTSLPDAIILK